VSQARAHADAAIRAIRIVTDAQDESQKRAATV
jgi:hypothetical protein